MKRTNLVLDEQLLEEVTRVSGERTYSRPVTRGPSKTTWGDTGQAHPRARGERPLGGGSL